MPFKRAKVIHHCQCGYTVTARGVPVRAPIAHVQLESADKSASPLQEIMVHMSVCDVLHIKEQSTLE